MPRTKKQEYFDITSVLNGVGGGHFLVAPDDNLDGIEKGDMILFDRTRTKPKDGDLFCWGPQSDLTIGYYSKDCSTCQGQEVWGIAVALIRQFNKKPKRQRKAAPAGESAEATTRLRKELDRLERVPENEATRFQIESEIYKLERQTHEELWPDEIRV